MKALAVCLLCLGYCLSQAGETALYEERFEIEKAGIFLPVIINGNECKFLFDTGASFVVLDKKYKSLLGERLSPQETQARTGIPFISSSALTPNGEVELELYKAIPLKLGKLQVANRFPYMLADLQTLWPFSGVKFCGILGTSFLHQFRWEINFAQGTIKAYIGAEPYQGNYSSKEPIYWSKASIPYVGVDLHGRKIAFDIDLGDNGSGRMKKGNLLYLKRSGQVIKTQMQDIITVSSLSQSQEFRLRSLRFADVLYPEMVMQESQQNALGLSFFKRHDIVLDFPFNMLYLQHHKDYAKRQELDKSGIRVILKDNRFIVFSIRPLEGASIGDMKKGDEIISVNSNKGLSLYEIREVLRAKEGTEIFLTLGRDGQIFESKLILGIDPLQ